MELVIVAVTALAGLAGAGLWITRARSHATTAPAPVEDMFAYTMNDDPC